VGEAQTDDPDPQGEDFCGFVALGLTSSGTTFLGFMWQDGVMNPLPTLGGNNGVANQINSPGEVVGMAETGTLDSTCPAGGAQKLVFKPLWKNGDVQELPTYPSDLDGNAHAINDNGQAVGGSGICSAYTRLFLAIRIFSRGDKSTGSG
jgi:uncharacterized membrane protein